jgi:hypothetical protein
MDKIWSLFSGNSNILKFLLSPVRLTKCLGVCVPLHPPRKKALDTALKVTVLKLYSSSRETLLYFHVAKQKVFRLLSAMFNVDFTPSKH